MQNRASCESGLQPSMEQQHLCHTLIDGNHEDEVVRDDVVALNGHHDQVTES